MTSPVRVALIGVGGMARHHIRQMLKMQATTRIVALCEPSEAMDAGYGREEVSTLFKVL